MASVMKRKKSKSRRKIPRPISDRPGKRFGMRERVSAIPLVERVTAYHAKVKWCRRVCHGRGGWRTVGIRVREWRLGFGFVLGCVLGFWFGLLWLLWLRLLLVRVSVRLVNVVRVLVLVRIWCSGGFCRSGCC